MNESLMPYCGNRALLGALCLLLAALLVGCGQETGPGETATGDVRQDAKSPPEPASGNARPETSPTAGPGETVSTEKSVEFGSCDGENTVTVAEDLTGQPLAIVG